MAFWLGQKDTLVLLLPKMQHWTMNFDPIYFPCRLQKAGAVLVAKLATGEMAFDDVWWGGKVKNPWNLDEGSSGSSAGPAAAVVAGAVAFAVRQPFFPRCPPVH